MSSNVSVIANFSIPTCNATLSPELKLHIPVITMNGAYYWADLQYEVGATGEGRFRLLDVQVVADPALYQGCQAASFAFNGLVWRLNVPSCTAGTAQYWADLDYVPTEDGGVWFRLIDAGEL